MQRESINEEFIKEYKRLAYTHLSRYRYYEQFQADWWSHPRNSICWALFLQEQENWDWYKSVIGSKLLYEKVLNTAKECEHEIKL